MLGSKWEQKCCGQCRACARAPNISSSSWSIHCMQCVALHLVRTTCVDADQTCVCFVLSNEAYLSAPQVHQQTLQPLFPCLWVDPRGCFFPSQPHKHDVQGQKWYRAAVILDQAPVRRDKSCERAAQNSTCNLHSVLSAAFELRPPPPCFLRPLAPWHFLEKTAKERLWARKPLTSHGSDSSSNTFIVMIEVLQLARPQGLAVFGDPRL